MQDIIKKHVLKNAYDFNGKANPKVVLGKVIQEDPTQKSNIKELQKQIQETINELSTLSQDQIKEQLEQISPELLEKKPPIKKEKVLELPNAESKKVVMRFAPSPSGPLHLGHVLATSLMAELCKKYNGKLILRIEDTNPENIDPIAYTQIPEDLKWLIQNDKFEIITQSDRLGYYYDHAEKLIEMGHAYVCTCEPDNFKELINDKKPCPCRDLPIKENQERFAKMFGEYNPGEAVLRIKTDITHKNPAMRDWPAMRINEHPHPKTDTKHRLWPLMNFSVAIDDHLLGVTHAIRGKDHMDNEKRQLYLYKSFNWQPPIQLYIGRINFKDLKISCSKTKQAILRNEYTGWDDIRLPFLMALKRRGYNPNAFYNMALEIGISENDKHTTKAEFFKLIDAKNKEIIDKEANRYFFVQDPEEITIHLGKEKHIELPLHPDFKEKGTRKFEIKNQFYISKQDKGLIKPGRIHRLMDAMNFAIINNKYTYADGDYTEYKINKFKGKIIHFIPKQEDHIEVELNMDDGTIRKGIGEKEMKNIKVNQVVQLERVGFAKLDKIESNKLVFWFLHK